MKTRFIFILALIVLMTGRIQAQSIMGVNYSTSLGTGNMGDYISKYCFRGIGIDYKGMVREHVAAGISAQWNLFYEKKDYDSYTWETITATGKQYRYTHAVPMMATLDYTDETAKGMQWYVGLGVGTCYIDRITDFGAYRFNTDTWQFLMAPEVGLLYPVGHESSVYATLRYHMNFKTQELEAQPFLSINLGFAWGSLDAK